MKKLFLLVLLAFLAFSDFSCGMKSKNKAVSTKKTSVKSKIGNLPVFNADSAYEYTAKQVSFGKRVPNMLSHEKCKEYLVSKFKSYRFEVTEQKAALKAYDGTVLKSTNIIASINKENKNRILLMSHWDSRPYADQDPNPENWKTPIDAANDGASGVGVLIELARAFSKQNPGTGIDIVLFDSEDYGAPEFYKGLKKEEYWGLGSQYWAKKASKENYNASFGILLDMVGGCDAVFECEDFSMQYAQDIVHRVWKTAYAMGYGDYFKLVRGGGVIDDHYYVNKITGIPCIDIIDFSAERGFNKTWHTLDDNMKNIDRNTLNVVGSTLIQVIYNL